MRYWLRTAMNRSEVWSTSYSAKAPTTKPTYMKSGMTTAIDCTGDRAQGAGRSQVGPTHASLVAVTQDQHIPPSYRGPAHASLETRMGCAGVNGKSLTLPAVNNIAL